MQWEEPGLGAHAWGRPLTEATGNITLPLSFCPLLSTSGTAAAVPTEMGRASWFLAQNKLFIQIRQSLPVALNYTDFNRSVYLVNS